MYSLCILSHIVAKKEMCMGQRCVNDMERKVIIGLLPGNSWRSTLAPHYLTLEPYIFTLYYILAVMYLKCITSFLCLAITSLIKTIFHLLYFCSLAYKYMSMPINPFERARAKRES